MSQPVAQGGGREQRTAPRVNCQIPAELQVDGQTIETVLRDISATGVAVDYGGPVELGQVFQLSFALPDDRGELTCAGLVRGWRPGTAGRLVGLEFHNLAPDSRRAAAMYVRWVQSGQDIEQARSHWSQSEPGAAQVVDPAEAGARPMLRWAPGFAAVVQEVAAHLATSDQVFVPVNHHGLSEGDRLYLELVPPSSHVVIRTLAEVTWVQTEEGGGVGLRLAGMTALDNYLLRSMGGFFEEEADRYR
jgi:hypothetical protein